MLRQKAISSAGATVQRTRAHFHTTTSVQLKFSNAQLARPKSFAKCELHASESRGRGLSPPIRSFSEKPIGLGWVMLPLLREVCGRLPQLSIPRFRRHASCQRCSERHVWYMPSTIHAWLEQSYFTTAAEQSTRSESAVAAPDQWRPRRMGCVGHDMRAQACV